MMNLKETKKISKFMSYVLRHDPSSFNISMDENGWVQTEDLLKVIRKRGNEISFTKLYDVVKTNNKQRFAFNHDKSLIRANQGHSIDVDVNLIDQVPPEFLYHGTAVTKLHFIHHRGLLKMQRNHVHLSADIETAKNVGMRHGRPVVLTINALDMFRSQYTFYLSDNGVWLTENVPVEYILFEDN